MYEVWEDRKQDTPGYHRDIFRPSALLKMLLISMMKRLFLGKKLKSNFPKFKNYLIVHKTSI